MAKKEKTFTLFWMGGTRTVVHGTDVADAMDREGMGAGVLKNLDFWSHGDDESWVYDKSRDGEQSSNWYPRAPRKARSPA